MSNDGSLFFLGVFVAAFAGFLFFHAAEATCQAANNVADCEWSRSPFTPTIQEPHK